MAQGDVAAQRADLAALVEERAPALVGHQLQRAHQPGDACLPDQPVLAQLGPASGQVGADVVAHVVAPACTDEYLALYQRYLAARHPGGGMDDHGAHEFEQFLMGAWSNSRFLELREQGSHRLLAVAVTDLAPDALSAVYTFYDPDETARGLGTLGVLRQIEWARRDDRAHLYLGYWIAGHPKMDYKRRFRPLEGFDGRGWHPLED